MGYRIGRVHTVHLGRLEDDLGFDLDRAQCGGGVGGEVRVASAGGQDDDASLLGYTVKQSQLNDIRQQRIHAILSDARFQMVVESPRFLPDLLPLRLDLPGLVAIHFASRNEKASRSRGRGKVLRLAPRCFPGLQKQLLHCDGL